MPSVTKGQPLETKLLTYEELGQALGIAPASAKRLAIRRKWAKRLGNDGKTRVTVPIERLPAEPVTPVPGDDAGDDTSDVSGVRTSDDAGDNTDATLVVRLLNQHVGRLERELEAIRAKLEAVEHERDAERARAAQVAVLEALIDTERRHTGELRRERDRMLDQLTAAHAENGVLRERMADTERDRDRVAADLGTLLALPWWRRLFA